MMNDKITIINEYLSSSVENNEVTNVDKLTLAIDELENFPMTFEILENSRVSQTLQSVRHSKQITIFINERIRSLIKCWRLLLNDDIVNVVPKEIKRNLCKTPAVKNGYTNGFVVHHPSVQNEKALNEINDSKNKTLAPSEEDLKNHCPKLPASEISIETSFNAIVDKDKENNMADEVLSNSKEICIEKEYIQKSPDPELAIVKESDSKKEDNRQEKSVSFEIESEKECKNNDDPVHSRTISDSSKLGENLPPKNELQNTQITQIGKPKVKSTKELLADFSNFIENDVKNKILMDKISQEDDEPTTYFPKDSRIKELVQLSILQEKYNNKSRPEPISLRKRRTGSIVNHSEPEETTVSSTPKCALLLKQFNEQCITHPRVVLKHFVPWPNLKRGLQMHAPEIRQPLSKRKRSLVTEETKVTKTVEDPISIDVINNLLESFEGRAQQKQMLTDAIQQRKEQTKVIDNTLSLVDMSLKLKLKIPKVPTIKIRRKKTRKKKKKPKIKPLKIKVKKPRKPWVRPMPPVTNYLDDIPLLPTLIDSENEENNTPENEMEGAQLELNEENTTKLAYGVLEGYNCIKERHSSQIYLFTEMYSRIVHHSYLHIFPWVDLQSPTTTTFPDDCNDFLQSILNRTDFYC